MARLTTRRAFALAAAATLAGCTGDGGTTATGDDGETTTDRTTTDGSTTDNPALGDADQLGDLELTSSAFEDGGPIPGKYGRDAEDVNPPLSMSGVPDGAKTLTLVVDDPDALEPAGKVWLHWLVWNIPASRTEIPEDWTPTDAAVGTNDFGERDYGGPAPPDEEHAYRFKLYALETTLDLPESAGKRDVGEAMRGSILARTQLTGTYAP